MDSLKILAFESAPEPTGYPSTVKREVNLSTETRNRRGMGRYTVAVLWCAESGDKVATTGLYHTEGTARKAAHNIAKRRGWVIR